VDRRRRTEIVFRSYERVCPTTFDIGSISMASFASAVVFCGLDSVDLLVLRVFRTIRRGAHRLILGLRPSGIASFIGNYIYESWSDVRAVHCFVLAPFLSANGVFFSSLRANRSPERLAPHDGLIIKSRDPPALCECSNIDIRSFKMCACPYYIAMSTASPRCGADMKIGRAHRSQKCTGMATVSRK
jgi:hypothetical protein